MSDNFWLLTGVDPEARARAEADAARLGVSLADHVADLVVRQALIDQLNTTPEDEQTHSQPEGAAIFASSPESPEGFAVRQRLKALERRLGAAVGSLDGAISALDSSLFDITARVGDAEALAGDTAHALGQTRHDVNNAVAGLQVRLAVVEDNLTTRAGRQEERCRGLDRRVDEVERSASILAGAHEALKHAVAEDFTTFAYETADRLNAGLAELRAAADAAAAQADAAVAHLLSELRGLRASLEDRLEQNAEETRSRMQAAFADAAERMAALGDRVTDNERALTRTAEQLGAQLADLEDGAQAALEETAHALRTADAALGVQIAAVSEEQTTQLSRLQQIEAAVETTIGGVAELRASFERRADDLEAGTQAAIAQTNKDWDQRFDVIAGRLGRCEQQAQTLQQRLDAKLDRSEAGAAAALEKVRHDAIASRISRSEQQAQALQQRLVAKLDNVEAGAFAALETLRRDLAASRAASSQQLDQTLAELRQQLDESRDHAANDLRLLRDEHVGAAARMSSLGNALTRLEGASISTNTRLTELEASVSAGNPELEHRLARLEHAQAAEAESTQGLARMLNRVAAQSLEASQSSDDRACRIEAALADLRVELQAQSNNHAVEALNKRLTAFELRQSSALDALRADIARFVADNDRRLEALETRPPSDQGDLAAEFEQLRNRIEERVLGVELRSVRTLEQVVETVATLEQRFLSGDGEAHSQTA